MIAWIPFLGPAPAVTAYWWVLVAPMALFISMAWKAVRQEDLHRYWPAVLRMSLQVVLAMAALTLVLAVVVRGIVPVIPAE